MDDLMPGRDGPENLRILKKSQLKVDTGPCRQRVEFLPLSWELGILPLSRRVEFSNVTAAVKIFRISTGRDELKSLTPRDVPNDRGGVSIV